MIQNDARTMIPPITTPIMAIINTTIVTVCFLAGIGLGDDASGTVEEGTTGTFGETPIG